MSKDADKYLEESVERMLGSSVHFDLAEEGDSVRNEIVSGADVTNAVVNLLSRGSRLLLLIYRWITNNR